MRLEQVMSSGPVVVDPADKLVEAARTMAARRVSSALVVRDGRLVGIVTERDLSHKVVAEALSPEGVAVAEVMTPDPVTAGPGTSAWEALGLMTVKGIRHLPVCVGGRPVGVVSMRDLMSATHAEIAELQARLAGLDAHSRARMAGLVLWATEEAGLRRDEYHGFPGEE